MINSNPVGLLVLEKRVRSDVWQQSRNCRIAAIGIRRSVGERIYVEYRRDQRGRVLARRQCGYRRGTDGLRLQHYEVFHGQKKERPIMPVVDARDTHRAAESSSKIVEAQRGLRHSLLICEPIVGIGLVITKIFE